MLMDEVWITLSRQAMGTMYADPTLHHPGTYTSSIMRHLVRTELFVRSALPFFSRTSLTPGLLMYFSYYCFSRLPYCPRSSTTTS